MPASNIFRLGFALQTAKGTPAAAPQYLLDVTASDLGPQPNIEQREETGSGRDGGDSYVSLLSFGGSASVLLRPKFAGFLLYALLGAKAVTGVASPYSHTLIPADDQPWVTIWRFLSNSIYERAQDCKITRGEFSWEAGGDVAVGMQAMGLRFERLTAIPVGGVYDSGVPFRVPGKVRNTIEGAVNDTIPGGTLVIEAAQTAIQTTQIYNSYLEPARREITANWQEVYQSIDRYAKILYGSAAGTVPTETVYEGAVKFGFGDLTAGPGLEFDMPRFGFQTTNADPNPDGAPLRIPVAGKAYRPPSAPIVTARVVNDVAAYAA